VDEKFRYVKVHKGDVWNPPDWALEPAVSVKLTAAATLLGCCKRTLLYKTDQWGLTVLRGSQKARFFLLSEIEELISGKNVDSDTIRRSMKGRDNGSKTTLEGIAQRQARRGRKSLKD
jgi:hypothetical protein